MHQQYIEHPGLDGVPYRQMPGEDVPFIREDDPQHKQPKLLRDAFVRVFDLSKPKELLDYQDVMQDIGNGRAVFSIEERQYVPTTKNWKILLRWWVPYLANPVQKQQPIGGRHGRVTR